MVHGPWTSLYLYNPMVGGPWVGLPNRHYITKTRGGQPCDSIMLLCPAPAIRKAFTKRFGQNLAFKLQNMPWGDSMPNRPSKQTS